MPPPIVQVPIAAGLEGPSCNTATIVHHDYRGHSLFVVLWVSWFTTSSIEVVCCSTCKNMLTEVHVLRVRQLLLEFAVQP